MTAVDASASSYLTVFPADVVAVPNASNLNWLPAAPPTPNKVDVKLSPTGAIKLFNNAGTVNVLADIVGYYQDHNHDARYPRKVTIPFSLAAGALSSPIELPVEVPISLTAITSTLDVRGVASAALYTPGTFVEWTGQNSPGTAAGTNVFDFDSTPGFHIVYIDYSAQVDLEVNSGTSIRVHNESIGVRSGIITLTW